MVMTEALKSVPTRDEAEETAVAALVFLTEEQSRLTRFLAESGLAPADLRAAAGEPHMLAAVLDHLLADESLLLVFTAGVGLEPSRIGPMRSVLDGEPAHHDDATAIATQRRAAPRKGSKRWPGP
jgi:hypothetical protein